eukprot:253259-Pyramimonas_sp.AAC.1
MDVESGRPWESLLERAGETGISQPEHKMAIDGIADQGTGQRWLQDVQDGLQMAQKVFKTP